MLTILHISNLSSETTPTDLETLFKQAGTVESARVITDHRTGESRWFGFVEMSSAEEAQNALNVINHQPLHGKAILVREAKLKHHSHRRDKRKG